MLEVAFVERSPRTRRAIRAEPKLYEEENRNLRTERDTMRPQYDFSKAVRGVLKPDTLKELTSQ
jgi:hypothetical protein